MSLYDYNTAVGRLDSDGRSSPKGKRSSRTTQSIDPALPALDEESMTFSDELPISPNSDISDISSINTWNRGVSAPATSGGMFNSFEFNFDMDTGFYRGDSLPVRGSRMPSKLRVRRLSEGDLYSDLSIETSTSDGGLDIQPLGDPDVMNYYEIHEGQTRKLARLQTRNRAWY